MPPRITKICCHNIWRVYLVQVSVYVSWYQSVMFPQLISIVDILLLYVCLIYLWSIRLVYIFVMVYLVPYTLDISCVYSGWQTHGLCHAVMFISITDIWHITVICHSTILRGYAVDKDYICYWYAVFPGLCWYIR